MQLKRAVTIVLGVTVAAGFAWFAATRGPLAPTQVTLATASEATVQAGVFGVGTIEARYAYAVGPIVAGRVLRVLVDHGDRVRAGQLVAELDPVDLRERAASAEAAIARAHQSIRSAEAQAREAGSRHQLARANADRYRDLAARNFVSREAAEVRQNEASVTQAMVDATRAALAAAERDADRLHADRRALDRQLASLRLVAPVDGVVVGRLAEPGTTVVAGQAVVRLIDPASVWMRARVDQAQAGALTTGLPATVTLRSAQDATLEGRVARIDLQSDAITEERIVYIALAVPGADLGIGELAEVLIQRPAVAGALVVPSAAIKRLDQRTGVWRMVEGRARFQPVRTGLRTLEGRTQVLEGLSVGDDVIVHSTAQLMDAMRIRLAPSR